MAGQAGRPWLREPPSGPPRPSSPPGTLRQTPGVSEQAADVWDEPLLFCAGCLAPITDSRRRCSRAGSHRHVFANPYGYVFEIGCFDAAFGVAGIGPVSTGFSWFAGTAWQTVVCAACRLHLGWRYDGSDGDAFFGLILDRLRSDGSGTT